MIAYHAGYGLAWDNGAKPYEHSMNPFDDPEQQNTFKAGYLAGCRDKQQHESSTSQAPLN